MAGRIAVRQGSDLLGHAATGAMRFVLCAWMQLAVIIVFDLLLRWNFEMARADLRWFLGWCWPRWFDYEAPYPQSARR